MAPVWGQIEPDLTVDMGDSCGAEFARALSAEIPEMTLSLALMRAIIGAKEGGLTFSGCFVADGWRESCYA